MGRNLAEVADVEYAIVRAAIFGTFREIKIICMNTSHLRKFALLALFGLSALSMRADSSVLTAILKERDDTLVKILDFQKAYEKTGIVLTEAVFIAEVALYSFRREAATSTAEKIKNQTLIVAIHDRKEAALKAKLAAGVAGPMEILQAKNEQLQARQLLETLKG